MKTKRRILLLLIPLYFHTGITFGDYLLQFGEEIQAGLNDQIKVLDFFYPDALDPVKTLIHYCKGKPKIKKYILDYINADFILYGNRAWYECLGIAYLLLYLQNNKISLREEDCTVIKEALIIIKEAILYETRFFDEVKAVFYEFIVDTVFVPIKKAQKPKRSF